MWDSWRDHREQRCGVPGVCAGSRDQSQLWPKSTVMECLMGFRQTTGSFDQRGQAKGSIPALPSGSLGQVHSMYSLGVFYSLCMKTSILTWLDFTPPLSLMLIFLLALLLEPHTYFILFKLCVIFMMGNSLAIICDG